MEREPDSGFLLTKGSFLPITVYNQSEVIERIILQEQGNVLYVLLLPCVHQVESHDFFWTYVISNEWRQLKYG